MKVLKLTLIESMNSKCSVCNSQFANPTAKLGNWQIMEFNSILDELNECENGDKFLLEIKEMTKDEFESLPVFVGY